MTDNQELLAELRSARVILLNVGEENWSGLMQQAIKYLEDGQTIEAKRRILGWFGGMGSFNDLVLCSLNGHKVSDNEYLNLNRRMDRVRSRLYQLVKESKND